VLDSACSSSLRLLLMAAALCVLSACVSVRPEEKEHLAEPAMSFGDEGMAEQHEQHVLDNREGSTGGGDTRGGGCGCN
jgi:hypothetical protein